MAIEMFCDRQYASTWQPRGLSRHGSTDSRIISLCAPTFPAQCRPYCSPGMVVLRSSPTETTFQFRNQALVNCSSGWVQQASTTPTSTLGLVGIPKPSPHRLTMQHHQPTQHWLPMVRRGGRYAASGAIAGPLVELDVRTLYLKDLTLIGATFQEPTVFENLIGYIERSEIRPLVHAIYPLHEIARAQEDFLNKNYIGKLVLIPPH